MKRKPVKRRRRKVMTDSHNPMLQEVAPCVKYIITEYLMVEDGTHEVLGKVRSELIDLRGAGTLWTALVQQPTDNDREPPYCILAQYTDFGQAMKAVEEHIRS